MYNACGGHKVSSSAPRKCLFRLRMRVCSLKHMMNISSDYSAWDQRNLPKSEGLECLHCCVLAIAKIIAMFVLYMLMVLGNVKSEVISTCLCMYGNNFYT